MDDSEMAALLAGFSSIQEGRRWIDEVGSLPTDLERWQRLHAYSLGELWPTVLPSKREVEVATGLKFLPDGRTAITSEEIFEAGENEPPTLTA